MKNFIFTTALACMSVVAGFAQGYSIRGTVSPGNDGKKVYIGNVVNRQVVKTDSAVVKNSYFQIDGKVETPKDCYIIFNHNGKDSYGDFILENNIIAVNISTKENVEFTVMGTPANNAYSEYKQIIADYRTKSQPIGKQMEAAKGDKAKTDSLVNILRSLSGTMNGKLEKLMEANLTNYQGLKMSQSYYNYWPVSKTKEILAKMPADLHNTDIYKKISSNVEVLAKTAEGQHFTDFAAKTPEGKTIKLSKYAGKGKYVLIDFWASWCGPCMGEMPNVVKAYKEFKSKGLEIVGVSLDSKADAWKKALVDQKMTWPQMSDLKGWQCEAAGLYGVRGIPATVLIDRKGTIIARNLRGEALLNKLKELMP